MELREFEEAILAAAVSAEEANVDPDAAARDAARLLDPDSHRYHLALQRLDEDGYVDARLNRGNDRLMSAHLVKVRPRGVDAVRNHHSVASAVLNATDRQAVEVVLTELHLVLESADLSLNSDDRADLMAQVSTLDAQSRSPRPRRRIMVESLKSIRSILEGAAGSAACLGVVALIQQLKG